MGYTPLAWAAWNGYVAVVELLLSRAGIDPGKPDENGHTPLMVAACGGYEGVVKILLRREDATPISQMNTAKHHFC